MAKSVLKVLVFGCSVLLLPGCSGAKPYFDVLQGNYTYQQGKFAQSTFHYLSALEADRYPEWVSYNLGNVYHALGESEAALEIWNRCGGASDEEILFRVSFNRGTLLYEMGKYREAYDAFRQALEIRNTDMDAKINLELSLQKVQALSGSAGGTVKDREEPRVQEEKEETRRILEYVRRKEGELRSSHEQQDTERERRDW